MKKRIISFALALLLLLGAALPVFAQDADDDEFEPTPSFWVSEEDHLRGMGYGDMQDGSEMAVGDELWVSCFDAEPADVFINGELVHTFGVWDANTYIYTLKNTGALTLAVRRGDEVLFSRSYNVISSSDMYKKNVKREFDYLSSIRLRDFFPSISELQDAASHGFPVGNPFLPAAFVVTTMFDVFSVLFSFVKIVR